MTDKMLNKTFLDSDDVCALCECGKTKSYQIINDINKRLMKKGYMTFKGKVLAIEVYRSFNMTDYLDKHDSYANSLV